MELRFLTFNLRVDTPHDGENRWDCRKELALGVVQEAGAHVLGTQEALAHQAEFLREGLTGHDHIGAGRDDGAARGEQNALYVDRGRLSILGSGTFWLSPTAESPGAMGWDAAYSRIATWVRAVDTLANRTLTIVNTHLDHRGVTARLEGAKQVRRWLEDHCAGEAAIVLGDMNCREDSPPLACFLETAGDFALLDGFRQVHKVQDSEEATFHGFRGATQGARIDFILHTPHFVTTSAEIVRSSHAGRYPSDHYPVAAALRWE